MEGKRGKREKKVASSLCTNGHMTLSMARVNWPSSVHVYHHARTSLCTRDGVAGVVLLFCCFSFLLLFFCPFIPELWPVLLSSGARTYSDGKKEIRDFLNPMRNASIGIVLLRKLRSPERVWACLSCTIRELFRAGPALAPRFLQLFYGPFLVELYTFWESCQHGMQAPHQVWQKQLCLFFVVLSLPWNRNMYLSRQTQQRSRSASPLTTPIKETTYWPINWRFVPSSRNASKYKIK